MLPRVKIQYMNGQLGTVGVSPDGLFVLACVAAVVADTFALGKAYTLRSVADLAALGVTAENNAVLHKHVTDFYNEAENGTELVVWGMEDGVELVDALNKDTGTVRQLLESEKGKLRGVFVCGDPADDVVAAMPVAQALAEWSTADMYAPIFVVLEGAVTDEQKDLTEEDYNRVAVLVGNTTAGGGACMGTMAGRLASIPVHRNIGRVKDGALYPTEMYIGDKEVAGAMSTVEDLDAKGYIAPRSYVGRSGYYFSDDNMACAKTDDYAHLSTRRTIDKAYRIAYDTLLDVLLDEIEVNNDGTMQVPVVKAWQQMVENAINSQMTAAGELSAEDGSGCVCYIDEKQNVVSTSTINVTLKVRPYATARYVEVNLGFDVKR